MSTVVTYNSTQYTIPSYSDTGYAQGPGNLSAYLVALATGCVNITGNQTVGGNKTFSSDIAVLYAGQVRLSLKDTGAGTAGVVMFSHNNTTGSTVRDNNKTFEIYTSTLGDVETLALTISSSQVATFLGQLIGKGTTTNDSAAAGYIGELIGTNIVTGSAVTLDAGSGNFKNITSISLTAGDWDVCGIIAVKLNGAGGSTYSGGAISIYSGVTTTDHTVAVNVAYGAAPGAVDIAQDTFIAIPKYRLSLSGAQTVYLKGTANYSSGNLKSYGSIYARRVR